MPAPVPNPFDATIVRNLWTDPPDVPSINAAVSEGLLEAIERVVATGESSGVVVQGEAGTGKTHLLSRLRRTREVVRSAGIIQVPPLVGHPREFVRHLLYHLVASLQRTPADGGMPPIREIFVSFVTRRVLKKKGRVRVNRKELREIRRRARPVLREHAPSADPDVLRALEAYVRGREEIACDWLRGQTLDPDELAEIGLERSIEGEDQALRVIEAIAALAALSEPRRILLFTFDQVDGYVDAERRRRFAEVAAELIHRDNVFVLTMCLPATWKDIERDAPAPLTQRLSRGGMPPLAMRGLSAAEIRQLLELRLETAFAGRPRPTPLHPFEDRDFVAITSLAPGRVPARRVLTEARERFDRWRTGRSPERRTAPDPASRAEAILGVLRKRIGDESREVPEPDQLQTRALARFALECCGTVDDPPPDLDDAVDLVVADTQEVGLVFVDGSDARSIWRRLERILDSAGRTLDHVIVVRDVRARRPARAPKTERLLDRIDAGADTTLFSLEPEVLREMGTARALVNEAAAGDFSYRCGGEQLRATREEVLGALRRAGLLRENALVAEALKRAGIRDEPAS